MFTDWMEPGVHVVAARVICQYLQRFILRVVCLASRLLDSVVQSYYQCEVVIVSMCVSERGFQ